MENFLLGLKNTKVASLLNLTPETLSRTLTKFKKRELIKTDEHFKVLDENTLVEMYAN